MAREEVKRKTVPPRFPKRDGSLDPEVIAKKIVEKALADDEPKKDEKEK